MSYPDIARQTIGEPLANPWYLPGFTSQNPNYLVLPPSQFNITGFPTTAIFVTLTGNYFDDDGNPISGFLTFYPSAALTLTDASGTVTIVPQRFVGRNLWDVPGAFWGTGHMFLKNGNLQVSLLATDNSIVNMVPANFSYHVVENFLGGRTYDIMVPSTSVSPVDINSLIIPGSFGPIPNTVFQLAAVSTEFVPANITAFTGGTIFNPTSDEVDFAFISGPTEPQNTDWHVGSWVTGGPPYIAEILVGPANGGLVLAKGTYIVWCRVIATPQVPVFPIGTLQIY